MIYVARSVIVSAALESERASFRDKNRSLAPAHIEKVFW